MTAWVFGREFADRTIRLLLAIPTPRGALVIAKTLVVFAWCAASAAWVMLLGLAVGAMVGLPGWSAEVAVPALGTMAVAALLVIALQTGTAFAASAGRGYIPPLAWAVFTIFLAQILSVLGWGAWFPWAVPALLAGVAGPEGETVSTVSFVLVFVAAALGLVATIIWWQRADQTG
jgi:ABC-2 type transport system permease protein